ncbi:hypothetical protein GQ55_9G152300 [Panicum hallii var. hallii]|uniref:Uncharacterized protein n=1 Tax=Panicum hallii var. hallii TaxID=1504633 RepID=A0A2T7C3E2_9POAL|nr:hypothetical protein GQ55_9G152300 [Panicum hallii var. hallii]
MPDWASWSWTSAETAHHRWRRAAMAVLRRLPRSQLSPRQHRTGAVHFAVGCPPAVQRGRSGGRQGEIASSSIVLAQPYPLHCAEHRRRRSKGHLSVVETQNLPQNSTPSSTRPIPQLPGLPRLLPCCLPELLSSQSFVHGGMAGPPPAAAGGGGVWRHRTERCSPGFSLSILGLML